MQKAILIERGEWSQRKTTDSQGKVVQFGVKQVQQEFVV